MGGGSEGGAQNRSGHLEEHVQRAWGGTSTGIRGAGRRPEVAGPGRGRGRSEAENGASRGWDPAGPCRKPRLRSVTFGPRARGSQGRPLRRSRDWRQRVTARLALRGACWLRSGEWIGGPFREARAATRRETILEEGGGGGDKGPVGGTCRRRMRRALAASGRM